jgi:hypothetical protein
MRLDRPAKTAIRNKWLEILQAVNAVDSPHPIYLTLPGAEGKDIQLLIDEDLIRLTETGAIDPRSSNYCVAIENSPSAVLALQKRFPGLRILEQNVQSILRGESLLQYPERGEHRVSCQAHIINLDLQATLTGEMSEGDALFPVIRWIEKFAALQSECDHHNEWHLLLTLNATVEWSAEVCQWVSDFVRDNLTNEATFSVSATNLLGEQLTGDITRGETIEFTQLSLADRQTFLLVLVPKTISHFLCSRSWEIETKLNASYMGSNDAPMVTFIFRIAKARRNRRGAQLYSESVSQSLRHVQRVTREGVFENL